jgi:hypothetical protein
LGLQCHGSARRLDGIIVRSRPSDLKSQPGHGMPGLRGLEGSRQLFTEQSDVGEEFGTRRCHASQALECGQSLAEPPRTNVFQPRLELKPPGRISLCLDVMDSGSNRGRHPGRGDHCRQHSPLLVGAQRFFLKPFENALGKTRLPGLCRGLHDSRRDSHQIRRHVGAGGLSGAVQETGRLGHVVDKGSRDGRVAECQWIVGKGVQKSSTGHRRIVEATGGQFQLGLRGQKTGPTGVFRGKPRDLFEGRRELITLHEPLELLQVTDQLLAAELDLLAGASRTNGVGIDRHGKTSPGGKIRREAKKRQAGSSEMYQSHSAVETESTSAPGAPS